MAGAALAQGFLGGGHGVIDRQQVEVLPRRRIHPRLGLVWHRRQHRQGMADAFQRHVLAVGQGEQRLEGVLDLALGDGAIGARGVEAGLGFEHIGLVGKAHLEAFVGLVELALERGFLGLHRRQVVLRAQHGEVGLGALQDQVLLGDGVFDCGLLAHGFRSLELEPAVGTEDRLAQRRLIGGATA